MLNNVLVISVRITLVLGLFSGRNKLSFTSYRRSLLFDVKSFLNQLPVFITRVLTQSRAHRIGPALDQVRDGLRASGSIYEKT